MPDKVNALQKENETLKVQIANLIEELKNLKKMLEQRQETQGNIVSLTLMFPRLRALKTFVAETFFCFRGTKSVSELFEKRWFCCRKKTFLACANGDTLLQKHFTQCVLVCGGLENSRKYLNLKLIIRLRYY